MQKLMLICFAAALALLVMVCLRPDLMLTGAVLVPWLVVATITVAVAVKISRGPSH
ncbi:hypothetical protein ACFWGN_15095 [Oerskovia sp. NPDC060338]|uniref:Uncharacterized protein n=1 Tax=Oerskovia enterophila TaxID=43678 RepID=A0ABX2Y8B4_9CELL|nr:hypothetical protein [Oerskovia enterophila]OCI32837.1 hypothetical protein OERS_04290 [Oerskovia enterophila]